MKRNREDEIESVTNMAKCLMLLSRGLDTESMTHSSSRVFVCKTCNRQFSSFQALGGHRASHKRPRLMEEDQKISHMKPKTHECSICGMEFAIGQALGGHMRRHRTTTTTTTTTTSEEEGGGLCSTERVPVLKRSNSKAICFPDLNLTPFENELEFSIGIGFPEKITSTPLIHCFI